jgi:Zn-dependent protease
MMPTKRGSFRLFRVAGIDIFLHWSWFLVAVVEIQSRSRSYTALQWNVLEYLALFCLVLLHELGHALACRQVGGDANQIVLWPLGGVAYVRPPPRPGATLWSIAAGPLVNLALLPVFIVAGVLMRTSGLAGAEPNLYGWLRAIAFINAGLLVFNILPIYPLDGGQILRSLLWFPFGRARSLMIATIVGFAGVGVLLLAALAMRSVWTGVLALFILMNCWQGMRHALQLGRIDKAPRRTGMVCPSCRAVAPAGPFWLCARCQRRFDGFETHALCPHCGTGYLTAYCHECGEQHPLGEWESPAPPWPPTVQTR